MYVVNMEFSCLATIFASSIQQILQILGGLFNDLTISFPYYAFIIYIPHVACNQFFILIYLISLINDY